MSHSLDLERLCLECISIARGAGNAILTTYHAGFKVEQKDDNSPLTDADLASHHLTLKRLSGLLDPFPYNRLVQPHYPL